MQTADDWTGQFPQADLHEIMAESKVMADILPIKAEVFFLSAGVVSEKKVHARLSAFDSEGRAPI
jgi:hypothetical protein